MKNIDRRGFLKKIPGITAGVVLGMNYPGLRALHKNEVMIQNGVSALIPMPIQVVIDDVGWWSGEDGNKKQEPYRTGILRDHKPEDYEAIALLGRTLGIRPQAAMILCEWDKKNILRKLPSSTWMGSNWDNSKWIGKWQEEAAHIIRSNKANFELTLHGIGHEYWENGKFTRAEWADRTGKMRPKEEVEKHLDFYNRLLNQHKLGPFPVSFVPTAFLHGFGVTPGNDISMAEILKKHGVTYINTPFKGMYNAKAASHGIFGFDSGVMTIDRGRDLMSWFATGKLPAGKITGPTCGMHWANIIHTDPSRNSEIVEAWVKVLAPHKENYETMLAPDSSFFQKQLVHHKCTKISMKENFFEFDFNETDSLPVNDKKAFTVKIKGPENMGFTSKNLKIIEKQLTRKDDQYIHTLLLARIKPDVRAGLSFSVNG